MGRFSDWSPADQPGDPTPGDAFGVRGLASRWDHVASVAADVQATLERVRSASGAGVWVGQAGDVFRDKLGDFPTQVWQVRDSFSQSRDALNWWASVMEAHQSTADQGLAAAVAAQADLVSAQSSWASALAQQRSAQAAYSRQNGVFQQWGSVPAGQVPSGVSVPSGSVVRSLYRQQQDAASRVASASARVGDAQARLDAAKRLVASAKQSYQEDAHTAAGRLQAATDSAIPADSWWEKLTNSEAWKVLVTVATVVVVVAAVAGVFLSGPAGWIAAGIAFGAGALLTANDVAEFAKGNMSLGEFVVSMGLNFIPGGAIAKGGKALAKGVGAIARGAGKAASRAGEALAGASRWVVDGVISGVRNDPIYQGVLAAGRRGVDRATGVFESAGQGLSRTGMLSRVSGDLVLGVRETATRVVASQGMKGFVAQAAFGAAGNVGVYSVTNAADGKPWTLSGAAAAAAGGAAAGGLGSQAGHLGERFGKLMDNPKWETRGAGIASAGAEVAGGVVEDQLNGDENDYDMIDGLLDAGGGVVLSKFPDAAAISGANPSWGAHVGAAFAGENAGLGVDAAKFTTKESFEQLTAADTAQSENPSSATDSSNGAAQ